MNSIAIKVCTMSFIYRSPLPIYTFGPVYKNCLVESLGNQTGYTDWSDRIFIINQLELDYQRRLYNTSAMYLTIIEVTERLLSIQKRLQIKGFRSVQRGIFQTVSVYMVNYEFQFIERFNDILHRTKSSGLYDYLYRIEQNKRNQVIIELNLQHLRNKTETISNSVSLPVPIFLAYGWFASIVLFVVEVFWSRTFNTK